MKEMSKAIELKAKTKLIHYLTVENTKLKEQVFSIDRNNMILPIHQWHATNTKFKQLEKENTNLKDEIKHWATSWDILTKENAELKERFKADECDLCNDLQDENANLEATMFVKDKMMKELDDTITNLQQQLEVVKPFTKDRVLKEIEHEQMNLTGVILEIINRCFIDYEELPKTKDIIGILNDN